MAKKKRERLETAKPDKATWPTPDKDVKIATPEKYGAVPTKANTCKSCGHAYLKPCNDDEKRKAACGNWQHILRQQAEKKAKKK